MRGRGRRGRRHRSRQAPTPKFGRRRVADCRDCRDAVATLSRLSATVGDTVGDTVATVADSVAGLPTASRAFPTTYGGDRRAGAIFYLSYW